MKKLIIFLVIILSQNVFLQAATILSEVTKNFKVSKGGELLLNINPGNISISTWDKNEISIKIITEKKDDFGKLDVEQSGNRVRINYLAEWSGNNDINAEVNVPSNFNINATTSGGDIILKEKLIGNISLSSMGGDILTNNVQGSLSINTAGGDISVQDVNGKLNVNTSGGDISVGKIKGERAAFNTMGGDIKIEFAACDFNAKTFGGDIKVGDIEGNSIISTFGGDIELRNANGKVEMNTFGGDLSLESCSGSVKAETKGGDINLKKLSGTVDANTLSGNIFVELLSNFSGSAKIKTASGDINLKLSEKVKANINAVVKIRNSDDDLDDYIISDFKKTTSNKKYHELESTFKVNGGGNEINLNTLSGKIQIRKLK